MEAGDSTGHFASYEAESFQNDQLVSFSAPHHPPELSMRGSQDSTPIQALMMPLMQLIPASQRLGFETG